MDTKLVGGSIWGVPTYGTVVSLNSADVSTILIAASGLVSTLAKFGSFFLGIGIAAAYLAFDTCKYQIPINAMARVKTYGANFNGILLDESIDIQTSRSEERRVGKECRL